MKKTNPLAALPFLRQLPLFQVRFLILLGVVAVAAPLPAADALIGRWISGDQTLSDTSEFTAAGTHDGIAVGSNAASLAWSSDLPTGFPAGSSLDLSANNVAVQIDNSAISDTSYQTTFDDGISTRFTGAFWFKGAAPENLSGSWLSKSGLTPFGWQSRALFSPANVDFTMRSNSGESALSSLSSASASYSDGAWHHVAIVFDGTASYRKLYVDGVLKASLTGSPYSVNFATGSHLIIGGNQANAPGSPVGNFFPGKLYDVRMYNYPLTAGQITDLFSPQTLTTTKEISLFTFPGIGNATISGNSIAMTVPFSTDLASLAPTFVHTGASASPTSGSNLDFSTPQTYTITAANATTTPYLVTVSKAPISSACAVLGVTLGAYKSAIVGNEITLYVPVGTDVTNLSPSLTVSQVASISPLSGSPQNFTNPVTYTVTAENGTTTQTYSLSLVQTHLWINSSSSGPWSAAENWDPIAAPTSAATTVLGFNTAGAYTSTHDLGEGFLVNQLLFGAPTLALSGQGFQFAGSAPKMTQNSAADVTILNNLNLGLDAPTTISGSGAGAVNLMGIISGGSLIKRTPGNLLLNNANNHTGGTTIANGTLTVGSQTALGNGNVTFAGGTTLQQVNFEGLGATGFLLNDVVLSGGKLGIFVDFSLNKDIWLAGVVSGPGSLRIYGNQRGVILSGSNTFSGGVTVDNAFNGIRVNATHVNALGTGPLSLGSLAMANLSYVGDRVIASLTLNGVAQPNGTYGSSNSDATTVNNVYFSGTGTVTVGLRQQAKILRFVFNDYPPVVTDPVARTIKLSVPAGTDVTGLAPTYTLSEGAVCIPASGTTLDFSTPQSYTVTAEDGVTTGIYTVTVTKLAVIPQVTISSISQPLAGPGADEYTLDLTGISNFIGDITVEQSFDLVEWTVARTATVPNGAFNLQIITTTRAPKAFFRVKYP